MPNTRKKNYSKKNKTQTQRKSRASGATAEQIKQNRRRNKMIRNIRMGRIRQGGGGGFISQFIGKPWTPDSLGSNYFALSPKGVGTGVVPKFDDGQPLGSARYPTQLGPQLAKLGQAGGGGSRKRSRKNVRGGGFVGDFYDNAKYSLGKLTSRMEGINPSPNPNPYVQPISKTCI